jgi:hypothetical protein
VPVADARHLVGIGRCARDIARGREGANAQGPVLVLNELLLEMKKIGTTPIS